MSGWASRFQDWRRRKKGARKARRRQSSFEGSDWQREAGLARRRYASYEAYLEHQSAKLGKLAGRLAGREDEDLAGFLARFRACKPLAAAHSVLCLGARIGTEVKALHALGHLAVGIDLNPGPRNAWVLPGDFHQLVFPDACVDAVYTNCLDHVFDLPRVMAEVARVLRPGGLFVTDVLRGYEEGALVGDFEATHWARSEDLIRRICELTGFELEGTATPVAENLLQVVLRKPGPGGGATAGPAARR